MKSLQIMLFLLCFVSGLTAQDFALQQLENSPRHHEWVKVPSGERHVHCFVAYPEVSGNAQAVIVIHENRGLTDWVRSFADQLAAAGYLVIAPDLLSDFNIDIKKTSEFKDADAARNAIYELRPEQVTADLNAVFDYIAKVPASNGQVSVIGFCWGGSQSFRFATNNDQLRAALVFYGTAPTEASDFARIQAPVYGFYGGNDQRVNATIPQTEAFMKDADKQFEYEIYPDAGHAYMRAGDDPNGSEANKAATKASWERIRRILDSK
jgi:carboxymethylenebutenolidase